jgi:hypothetical protein
MTVAYLLLVSRIMRKNQDRLKCLKNKQKSLFFYFKIDFIDILEQNLNKILNKNCNNYKYHF